MRPNTDLRPLLISRRDCRYLLETGQAQLNTNALDQTAVLSEAYLLRGERGVASVSHLREARRALAYALDDVDGTDKLSECSAPEKFRSCDARIDAYVQEVVFERRSPSD